MSRKSKFLLAFTRSISFSAFNDSFLFLTTSASKDKIMFEHLQTHSSNRHPAGKLMQCHSYLEAGLNVTIEIVCAGFTCMIASHFACIPIFEPMWAEREYQVTVVRKRPEPKINQITELVYGFDVRVCSTEIKTSANIKCYVSPTHDSDFV